MLTDVEMAKHFIEHKGRCHMIGQCHVGKCPIETRAIRGGGGKAT